MYAIAHMQAIVVLPREFVYNVKCLLVVSLVYFWSPASLVTYVINGMENVLVHDRYSNTRPLDSNLNLVEMSRPAAVNHGCVVTCKFKLSLYLQEQFKIRFVSANSNLNIKQRRP